MSNLQRIFDSAANSKEYVDGYLGYLSSVIQQIDRTALATFADTLLYARKNGSQIFFIGNGGSASTASHFANDILFGTKSLNPPFQAISLCDNMAMVTAVANDFGFDRVFSVQLEALLHPGDVVVAISVSGNSKNILDAVQYANKHDAITVGLTGFNGGKLKDLVKINVHVPCMPGEYGPAEDLHLIMNHVVGSYLMYVVKAESAKDQALLMRSA